MYMYMYMYMYVNTCTDVKGREIKKDECSPPMRLGVSPLSPVLPVPVCRVGVEGVLHVLPGPQQLQLGVQVQVAMETERGGVKRCSMMYMSM